MDSAFVLRTNGFTRRERLVHQLQYQAVFSKRFSARGTYAILYALPNSLGYNRLGLSVGRKLGGAVTRVRWKRLAREVFRLTKREQPVGFDWILTPVYGRLPRQSGTRKQLEQLPSLGDLRDEVLRLMHSLEKRRLQQKPKAGPT